jgi:hypothetical protein
MLDKIDYVSEVSSQETIEENWLPATMSETFFWAP